MVVLFSILPFFSTLLGGFAAVRLRHRLHPVMAFAAGVLVATALASILPEAAEQVVQGMEAGPGPGGDSTLNANLTVGAAAIVGFLLFSAIEAFVHRDAWEHRHDPGADPHSAHAHTPAPARALVAPMALVLHSTLDGVAIGAGFRTDPQLGLVVALAVLAHDFADGMNVVTLALAWGGGRGGAALVLGLDAVAPVLGSALSGLLPLGPATLGALLASFAGVFIALGAGHLLPEAQHRAPGSAPALLLLAALGAGLVLAVRFVAG